MRLLAIQHVPFEGVGLIGEWASERGHTVAVVQALTEEYPQLGEFDFLVIMGGPMDADDEIASPWLTAEKQFITRAIAGGKLVLGVCLGAQILAEVLGGRVRRAREREIGWYPVTRMDRRTPPALFSEWPESVVVGHWHGDTFDLPDGLRPVLSSELTPNQAFVFDERVVGLQFHLEWDEAQLLTLLRECPGDLENRTVYVMSATEIADEIPDRVPVCRELLFGLLGRMEALGPRTAEEDDR